MVEWDLYTVLVAGSNPVSPTTLHKALVELRCLICIVARFDSGVEYQRKTI